ncbi:tyrosine-type recombinase/integrase [Nocardia sp. SYP-A9097]|uniref:tyrosine-type recombinase/integrase n=1 Tax=Nocardia sp. SYP-A9097 TaxID=2663237 RepID=UPI001E505CA7|nr:tyrosine-type recombinase/integrase [Nocardia sp. SYP-A9097]
MLPGAEMLAPSRNSPNSAGHSNGRQPESTPPIYPRNLPAQRRPSMPGTQPPTRRKRRAEPINKHIAKNGTVTYRFQVDIGTKPDGTRNRQQSTYRTLAEARREYRRITTEVARGTYAKLVEITADEACDQWLADRRRIRRNSLERCRQDLKPVRRRLGSKKLAQLTKKNGDALVEWMLTEGRRSPRQPRPDSLVSQVAEVIARHPDGISTAELKAEFGKDVHHCLAGLVRAGRVTRPRRAVYVLAPPPVTAVAPRGAKPVTVRPTLTTFSMMVQSYVDQGALPRNVIALVDRPTDDITDNDDDETNAKSWTMSEVEVFRAAIVGERLAACWLMSCYGMRRSEVLGARWRRLDATALRVRRGRVAIGRETEENLPKSRRSRRDLPPPADLEAALRALKTRQKAECLAMGASWSDDRLIAVHENGTPVRPDWYSAEFQRIRKRTGLRRIPLKGLRNTSVSLMLASGIPVHIVAAWHGHDPAMSLSIYSDAHPRDLKAAGAALFGPEGGSRPRPVGKL